MPAWHNEKQRNRIGMKGGANNSALFHFAG
jgi:hypothetical protein